MRINEIICAEQITLSDTKKGEIIQDFIEFARHKLHITIEAPIELSYDVEDAQESHHTGSYNLGTEKVWIYVRDRNLVDILRSISHELTHVKQNQDNRLHSSLPPGDKLEQEADAVAGYLIKIYGAKHHEIYQ